MWYQLQFTEIIDEINSLKTKRREWLLKTSFFRNNSEYIEFLLRITYELTDKDFEYFVAYILKNEWYTSIDVQWWYNDGGADIIAMRNGQEFFIQCKQWSSPYVTMKRAWEFYWTIYPLRKRYTNAIIGYVTTSFINDEVKDFFHDHHIDGTISNGKLLESCWKLGLFKKEWWEKMIRYIQQQRLLKLRNQWQKFFPIESEFRRLQNLRVNELRHHLSPYMQNKNIDFNTIDFSQAFFQYWDFV